MKNYDDWLMWIKSWVSKYLHISIHNLNEETVFAEIGLDSVGAVTLASDLEDDQGTPFEDALLWDYPTIGKLANYLAITQTS